MRFNRAPILMSFLTAVVAASTAAAQEEKTIWSGVFTTEQADRGKGPYIQVCAVCHGNTGRGGPDAPGITGNTLNRKYADSPLSSYFDYMQSNMPLGRANSLPPQAYADIVAFLLREHGAPAGDAEITPDPAVLDSILIVPKPQ